MQKHYSINGEEPSLVGKRCTGFILLHFHEGLQITNQVNVAHLSFDDQWYRLYFECGTVFWRESERPEAGQNTDLTYGLLLNDLSGVDGIVGETVEQVAYEGTSAGDVQVKISLGSGKALTFAYGCESDSAQLLVA